MTDNLTDTDPAIVKEQKTAAQKKVETILAEATKPSSDFAALATPHSSCPSGKGGDRDFLRCEGKLVETFTADVFAFNTGTITEHGGNTVCESHDQGN